MAQIICRDLSFAYDGETVLSDINFSLDAGAYLCLSLIHISEPTRPY